MFEQINYDELEKIGTAFLYAKIKEMSCDMTALCRQKQFNVCIGAFCIALRDVVMDRINECPHDSDVIAYMKYVPDNLQTLTNTIREQVNKYVHTYLPEEFENNPLPLSYKKRFAIPFEEAGFTTRTENCLKNQGLLRVKDLLPIKEGDMLKIPNLGRRSLNEIKAFLETLGLGFGMNPVVIEKMEKGCHESI